MKKLLALLISISLFGSLSFIGFGCKTTEVVETTTVAETTVAETTVAETEDENQVDPWILEKRDPLKDLRHELDYKGEYGQTATWDTELVLTSTEVEKIKEGNPETGQPWKVGFVMDSEWGDYTTALVLGLKQSLEYLGLELVGVVDPSLDPAKELAGVEDLLSAGAEIIIGAPVDANASAASFKPVLDAGKILVLWGNIPSGYEYGRDYIGVVSGDIPGNASGIVEGLKLGVTEKTEVCYMYFDAAFYVVNQIEQLAKAEIEADPLFEIVEEMGYVSGDDAMNNITAAISRHPNIKRAMCGWDIPAGYAAGALKNLGRDDVKISTWGANEAIMTEIIKGPNIVATTSQASYFIGLNLGILCGHAAIGKKAPEYTFTPAIPINVDNLRERWAWSQGYELPSTLGDLLKEIGK